MSRLQVACAAADDAYLPHSAAMLHSVLSVQDGQVDVHYLHGARLSAEGRRDLQEMITRAGGSISFLRIDDTAVGELTPYRRIPGARAIYYRFFLPDLLPQLERVLYLDADTIAVNSLSPLWETDLNELYIGAVTNVLERHEFGRPAQLGLVDVRQYINSGVLLMNLDLMRRDDCARALYDYALGKRDEDWWSDQDTLSTVLASRRLSLHPRWNVMNSVMSFDWAAEVLGAAAVEEARADPAIVHFEGPLPCKPWHLLCEHPLRDVYRQHRKATPWPAYTLQGKTPANLVRLMARRAQGRGSSLAARSAGSST